MSIRRRARWRSSSRRCTASRVRSWTAWRVWPLGPDQQAEVVTFEPHLDLVVGHHRRPRCWRSRPKASARPSRNVEAASPWTWAPPAPLPSLRDSLTFGCLPGRRHRRRLLRRRRAPRRRPWTSRFALGSCVGVRRVGRRRVGLGARALGAGVPDARPWDGAASGAPGPGPGPRRGSGRTSPGVGSSTTSNSASSSSTPSWSRASVLGLLDRLPGRLHPLHRQVLRFFFFGAGRVGGSRRRAWSVGVRPPLGRRGPTRRRAASAWPPAAAGSGLGLLVEAGVGLGVGLPFFAPLPPSSPPGALVPVEAAGDVGLLGDAVAVRRQEVHDQTGGQRQRDQRRRRPA